MKVQNIYLLSALFVVSLSVGAFDALRPFVWSQLLQGSLQQPDTGLRGAFWFVVFEIAGYCIIALREILAAQFATVYAEQERAKLAQNITASRSSAEVNFRTHRFVESVRYDVDLVENFLRGTLWAAVTGATFLAANGFLNITLPPTLAIAYISALLAGIAFNFFAFRTLLETTTKRMLRESEFSVGAQMHYRKALQLMRGPQKSWWLNNRLVQFQNLGSVRRRQYAAQFLYQYGAPLVMLAVFGGVVFVRIGDGEEIGSNEVAAALSVAFLVGPLGQLFAFSAEVAATREAWQRIRAPYAQSETTGPQPRPHDVAVAAEALTQGRSVLVRGPSGSGKTTLAVAILDALTSIETPRDVHRVFYLSESTYFEVPSLDPISVSKRPSETKAGGALQMELDRLNLLVTRFFPNHSEDDRARILSNALEADGEPFSSGERQRIQLICCLMERPNILILDEALSGCDQDTELCIVQSLLSEQVAILMINHRQECQELLRHGRPDCLCIVTQSVRS